MDATIIELDKILENELLLHERLLSTVRSMNAALKTESIDDVRAANKDYDECTCRIEALEEKRLLTSDAIARSHGLAAHANLSRIIESLADSDRGKLPELRYKLRAVLAEIHKMNAANKILLTESLRSIAKTFEFISVASEKFHGYKQLGKKSCTNIGRPIINTVA
jgi:flagellar biosynthesis/type III secretory pathway chaperone